MSDTVLTVSRNTVDVSTFAGVASKSYTLSVRVRGVLGNKSYLGGSVSGKVNTDGTYAAYYWNPFGFTRHGTGNPDGVVNGTNGDYFYDTDTKNIFQYVEDSGNSWNFIVDGADVSTGSTDPATAPVAADKGYVNTSSFDWWLSAKDGADVLKLVVSSPAHTYYLNAGTSHTPDYNEAFDYTVSIPVVGGATLTLTLDNVDYNQYRGDAMGANIPVAGLPDVDGVWAQLDYTSVANGVTVARLDTDTVIFSGAPTTLYSVTARVRTVTAMKTYTGGVSAGTYVNANGTPANDVYDVLKLTISNPSNVYYLNSGVSNTPAYNVPLDYTFTFTIRGGATMTLSQDNLDHEQFIGDVNGDPIPVSGLLTVDGIWAQIDYTTAPPQATCVGTFYNGEPVIFLRDASGNETAVGLERVPPLSADGGSGSSFDPMLARYIGGYNGTVPFVNEFKIRGLPQGNYQIYCYSNSGSVASSFSVTASQAATVTTQANSPSSLATSFVEGTTHVRIPITVPASGTVDVLASGFWAGLQVYKA